MKDKVLVIVGPTAVGKTALSIEVAKKLNGEIISGDSLQVYRTLDVGTAKATLQEQSEVPHHLIDIREITENYSVADFQQEARKQMELLWEKGKLPIIVGGTGLYIQALLYDFELGSYDEEISASLKQELGHMAESLTEAQLWEYLFSLDPLAAQSIHPNNKKRVLRAIELKKATGKSILDQGKKECLYDAKIIGLNTDRSVLYERINQRVELMLDAGVLKEAYCLYELGESQASQGIGYKEFFPYFDKKATLEECVLQVQQNSRRYAKRQLTWFRNRMEIDWWDLVLHPESKKELFIELTKWYEQSEGI